MVNPALKESNPALAEEIEALEKQFQGSFDLSSQEQQATLAEGCATIGRHIAERSSKASASIDVGDDGIVRFIVEATPET